MIKATVFFFNSVPQKLAKYVPGEFDASEIMGSISVAQSLPEEQYQGVVKAYGEVIKILSTIAVCVAVLTFCFTIRMESFGLSDSPKNHVEMEEKKSSINDAASNDNEKNVCELSVTVTNEKIQHEDVVHQEKIVPVTKSHQ